MNCVNYLMDDGWLIPLRSKQFKIRLLDKQKVKSDGFRWKMINLLVPIGITVLFGLGFTQMRKFRFGRKNNQV